MVGQIRVELNRLVFIFRMGFRGEPVHLLRVSRPLALFFLLRICAPPLLARVKRALVVVANLRDLVSFTYECVI